MGQKTHPKGFRLVTTQDHLSKWYGNKLNYANLIEEDFFLRSKIEKVLKDVLSISKIEIHRINQKDPTNEYVNITIHALFPRAKEMSRKVTKYFSEIEKTENTTSKTLVSLSNSKGNLKRFTAFLFKRTIRGIIRDFQIKTKKSYSIHLNFIKNSFEDARLIANFIAEQLEKRIPFRRAVKQTIKKVQRTTMKGIKIQLSGRLNGIDIARSEWKRDGRVPLHTLSAKIDYTQQNAATIYGVIGIKVWLFVGEEN